ncbi:CHAT domain-containing protein [Streptomyces sp. NPDC093250]|uniref:CHAT domain-containing protein n=1 Tax=Streptomyces sp. NPDC093250 TaxID=3366036 RepID=UPI0037F80EB6
MRRQAGSPNVTIAAHGDRGGHRFLLTGPDESEEPLILEVADGDVLRHCTAGFARSVQRTRAFWLRPSRIPLQDAGTSLRQLAATGRVLLTSVLRNAREIHDELGVRMRRWCPTWEDEDGAVPVLHVQAGTPQWLPWELLPLFDLHWDDSVGDHTELWRAARIFPGLSTVTERAMERPGQAVGLRVSGGRLPLRYLWHAGYPGAQGELGFFRSRPAIALEGPYPGDGGPYPGMHSFARHLADPGLGPDGRRMNHPHQVLHMSCHTTVTGDDSEAANRLVFHLSSTAQSEKVVDVEVHKVLSDLIPAWAAAPRTVGGLPLVFLNACSTALHDPLTLRSLMEPFVKNRNPSVIGTVAHLPDRIAEYFSRRFYEALLGGRTVGESLHTAKWDLLQTRRNPVGLLYALYGVSTLQVTPVPVSAAS